MFKYTEVFYNDENKSTFGFTWCSRSAQVNRAHLFSSIEHDRVTRSFEWGTFEWGKFVPSTVVDEVGPRALKNITSAVIRSNIVDEVVPRALKNMMSVGIRSVV